MKNILIIIFCSILHSTTFAQPTGNIEKDTAAANRLFEAALTSEKESDQILLFSQAVQLYEAYPFHEKQIEMNSRLAYAYFNVYEDSLCLFYAEKAIDLAVLNLGDDSSKSLFYRHYALLKLNYLKDIQLAIKHGEKALQIADKTTADYFDIAFLLITNYVYDNNIKRANELLAEVDRLINSTASAYYLAPLYRVNMQVELQQKNFEKAVFYGKQCLIENEKSNYHTVEEVGPIYVEIGVNTAELGNYKEGIQWIEDGIAYSKPTGINLASYYANLARIHAQANIVEKSNDYYQKAIAILSQDTISNRSVLQIIHHNISVNNFLIKDYPNALIHIKKSLAYVDNFYGKYEYANILMAMDKYEEALQLMQSAIIEMSTNFESNNIYDNPSKYEIYTSDYWATLLLIDKAAALIHKGIKEKNITILEKTIETADLSKFVTQRLLERMKGFDQSKLTNSVLMKKVSMILITAYFEKYQLQQNEAVLENLFKAVEGLKGMLLLETLTPSMLPDSVFATEERLVHQVRQYEQQIETVEKDSVNFYQTALFNASVDLEKFYNITNEQYPKEMTNFYNRKYTTTDILKTDLSQQTLLVEYSFVKGKTSYFLYIYTISKSNKNIFKIEVDELFLEKISTLNDLLQNPFLIQQVNREKFIQLSHELYQVLIAPIVKELGDKTQLIIIPEGKLFYLPFEVLLATNEIKPFEELDFLIKDFDISYQYSATIYHQLKQKTAIKDKSFLAFAPVFENGQTINSANRSLDFMVDSLYESIDNDKFISLPHTQKEVERIAKIITKNNGNANVLLKEKATKKELQTSLNQPYQFVHIATHGLVNYQNPKLSALACYENGTEKANDLLFANEIQMQNIQADLVILSSCESGIGRLVAGEGLIALNRSFIYSGANNVMFSLWKVNDEYTSELMIDFYNFYFQSENYTAALRKAKLKMLQDPITANPRYWAAFVLIGE